MPETKRGELTIFFGAAPGVGKTYAMLEAARATQSRDLRDLVAGVVETHGRFETAALMLGLELLSSRDAEFDLDAALARKPGLILLDELAHSNAEGSRHKKRWQDVHELLDAGIDVFSTLNVQHVESLNDVIAKVTGVTVRETVPDSVLEQAHEIKLVDLPPDDLLERLREGKVYVPAAAQHTIESFFRKGNLIALRELALRHTAERVDAQMRDYRRTQGIEQTWQTADQLLVAVSPSPYSARLIRATRRMAASLHARWFAVYVETRQLPSVAQVRLSQNLRLAHQLGAEVITLSGDDTSEEILRFARARNITKIIVGKPVLSSLWDKLRGSLVDKLIRQSGDIDVYMTAGDAAPELAPEKPLAPPLHIPSYAQAVLMTLLATATAWFLFGRDQLADDVMIYLLGILWISTRCGLGASVFAALCSVAALDFVFVPPYLTFGVADLSHAVTFLVMFLVAVVISGLNQRVRNQASAARERERTTAALYAFSRELIDARSAERVLEIAAGHLERAFACQVAAWLPLTTGRLARVYASAEFGELRERDTSVSQWVFFNGQEAGLGSTTLAGGDALHVPLRASGGVVGVLSLRPSRSTQFDDIEERRRVDAFATHTALSVERAQLAAQTEQARLQVETEQLRSSLLSSVSHDLRTPLAVITGAASTLVEGGTLSPAMHDELTHTILDEAERLNRLIRNLLDMTRLESGTVKVNKEWVPLEEVVGAALNRLDARLTQRPVQTRLPATLPFVPLDAMLLQIVLINLLENALKYSAGPIDISATHTNAEVTIEVADRGPGIPAGQERTLFEKFQRAVRQGTQGGVGLGLAICRAIVTAHGGRIWAANRQGGGAAFRFTLPIDGEPPSLPSPEELSDDVPDAARSAS